MTRFVNVNGAHVALSEWGTGRPVLCLHGSPEHRLLFERFAASMPEHRVIAVDWPGLGESASVEGLASPSALAGWVRGLLTVLELRDVLVFGHDMGGQPALLVGCDDRVAGVVAMNCLAMPDERPSWQLRVLRFGALYGPILGYLPHVAFAQCLLTFLETPLPSDVVRVLWAQFKRPGHREQLVRMCRAYDADLASLPSRYAACGPALVLWSEHDHHFDVAHGAAVVKRVPDAELQVLVGARHWAIWERAEEVAERIVACEARLSRAPSRP